MNQETNSLLADLVRSIEAPQYKPHLRGTLEAELLKLGQGETDVKEALDEFFKVAKH